MLVACILQENRGRWGGVGMVTLMHLHTCEMLRNCWAGVGMMTFMHLHTCEMLRTQNWGSLALGKHTRSKLAKLEKKTLVSRFGKKTLFALQHGITCSLAIACVCWSQGPGDGVTC